MKRCAHALVLLVFLGRGLAAQQLPTAPPASVGISSERLERMHRGMQAFVDRREVAGIVTLVAREGKIVDVHAVGFQDVESRKPMRADTIFTQLMGEEVAPRKSFIQSHYDQVRNLDV